MKLAVVGATGLVGGQILKVLKEFNLKIDELIPVASARSIGSTISYAGNNFKVVGMDEAIEMRPEIAIFSAGGQTSLEYAPRFAAVGTTVIDNSSAWRMDPSKKLIVPEINGHLLTKEDKIITENIGRSIHRIPKEDAMSFVHKQSASEWQIKKFDNKTESISVIITTLSGREDLAWTPDGTIIMSDGSKLFQYKPGKSKGWEEIATNFPAEVKGITRLAASADGKKLALVVSEE